MACLWTPLMRTPPEQPQWQPGMYPPEQPQYWAGHVPSRLASVAAGHVPSRPASVAAGHVYRKKWLLAARLKRSYAARVFQESCLSLKHSALTWKSSERANCCGHRTLMHFACVVGNLWAIQSLAVQVWRIRMSSFGSDCNLWDAPVEPRGQSQI